MKKKGIQLSLEVEQQLTVDLAMCGYLDKDANFLCRVHFAPNIAIGAAMGGYLEYAEKYSPTYGIHVETIELQP